MEKENLKKENLLLRIFKGIKKGWERLGQEDVVTEDSFRNRDINAQVARLEKIQEGVHNQKGFVQSAQVDEYKAQDKAQKNIRGKDKNITGERGLGG